MNYHDIPEYDDYSIWHNLNGTVEIKFTKDGELVLHLAEDPEADDLRIEDETFYVRREGGSMIWVRETEAIEMPSGIVDADYVELRENGYKKETQHNYVHLDNDVIEGRLIPLRVV